jgi:hypothetical protein
MSVVKATTSSEGVGRILGMGGLDEEIFSLFGVTRSYICLLHLMLKELRVTTFFVIFHKFF